MENKKRETKMCIGHIRSRGYLNLPLVSTEVTRYALFYTSSDSRNHIALQLEVKKIYGGGNLYICRTSGISRIHAIPTHVSFIIAPHSTKSRT